jgi:trans-2,3-dihydro-3-hydroxyanthranilate isomerase
MQVKFVTLDVFTDRQFGGNPLAVVADGTELSTQQMQAIAAEFNLAETTFVLPPEKPENTARVRIFTPRAELPFAGHPNVGTAYVLARLGECHGRPIRGDTLLFEETDRMSSITPASSASKALSRSEKTRDIGLVARQIGSRARTQTLRR